MIQRSFAALPIFWDCHPVGVHEMKVGTTDGTKRTLREHVTNGAQTTNDLLKA